MQKAVVSLTLRNVFPLFLAAFLGWPALERAQAGAGAVELVTAAEVRALSRAGEFVEHPVHLQGVVLLGPIFDGAAVVICDQSAGIYVQGERRFFEKVKPGDILEIHGRAGPGLFAPMVFAKEMFILGQDRPPVPKPVTFDDLASGHFDSQWVEIDGIVRCVDTNVGPPGKYRVVIATGGGRLQLLFSEAPPEEVEVDAKIRVAGVSLHQFSRGGQVMHPLLAVPLGQLVIVLKAPSESLRSVASHE